jgi:uncharacterized protein YbcI
MPLLDPEERREQGRRISDGIASIHREHYGRGARKVRTLIYDDVVLCRLEDPFTVVEKTMISADAFLQVRETRTLFQDWLGPRFIRLVEEVTGRKVRQFVSQVAHDPDFALELFLLEPNGGPDQQRGQ